MRKSSTLFFVFAAGMFVLACSQDLSIPYSEVESPSGGAGALHMLPKGGRGASTNGGSAAGGRFAAAGTAGGLGRAGQGGMHQGGDGSGAEAGALPAGAGGMPDTGGGSAGTQAGKGGSSSGGFGGDPAGMGGTAGDGATGQTPALLFSEYVEGSGTFKALEVFASSSGSLEGCFVELYFNGNLEASARLPLHGSVESGSLVTLCTSALSSALPGVCSQTANLNFNGDDAIALVCQADVLDVIGQIGVDPGSAWGDEVVRTLDRTLRRRCDVVTGDENGMDAFDPALQWQAFPIDTFDGLGAATCEN